MLADLAHHPATAEHLARKLVCHFVADEAPTSAVARIAKVFRDTDGSLPAVHSALLELPEAWNPAPRKYKTPHEFLISAYRACGFVPKAERHAAAPLNMLGQNPYNPRSPAGWPDIASQWDGPDALLKRVNWAGQLTTKVAPETGTPVELAMRSLGAALSERTRSAIARAANVAQGFTLWLASPEFLRR